VDLALERRNGDFVRSLINSRQVTVVHDLSDGGLVAAAAEMALASNVGITLELPSKLPDHALLFGEDQARYLIATPNPAPVLKAAQAAGVLAEEVGHADGPALATSGIFSIALADLRAAHEGWMPAYMGQS